MRDELFVMFAAEPVALRATRRTVGADLSTDGYQAHFHSFLLLAVVGNRWAISAYSRHSPFATLDLKPSTAVSRPACPATIVFLPQKRSNTDHSWSPSFAAISGYLRHKYQ